MNMTKKATPDKKQAFERLLALSDAEFSAVLLALRRGKEVSDECDTEIGRAHV